MTPIGVYVHIPFCTVKCGYCDFNAYAGLHHLEAAYGDALLRDIESWSAVLGRRPVESIFFGGGTPSEVSPDLIAAVISKLRDVSSLAEGAEVSLEANPGTITAAGLLRLCEAGVNRLSLGVQSFDDDQLRFLDRIHSASAARAAVSLAREAGFGAVSIDLMYGLPGQTAADWLAALREAVSLGPQHISTYCLTIEERTPLATRVARGEVTLPDADTVADMYDAGRRFLAGAGYEHYEISNFALPGQQSRHNRIYWEARDYVGIGAGAHGLVDGQRFENVAHPAKYIAAVDTGGAHPFVAEVTRPVGATAIADWVSLRLRLLDGFAPGEFETAFGEPLESVAGSALARCEAAGLVELSPRVRLTEAGLQMHGEVVVEVLLEARKTHGSVARQSLSA